MASVGNAALTDVLSTASNRVPDCDPSRSQESIETDVSDSAAKLKEYLLELFGSFGAPFFPHPASTSSGAHVLSEAYERACERGSVCSPLQTSVLVSRSAHDESETELRASVLRAAGAAPSLIAEPASMFTASVPTTLCQKSDSQALLGASAHSSMQPLDAADAHVAGASALPSRLAEQLLTDVSCGCRTTVPLEGQPQTARAESQVQSIVAGVQPCHDEETEGASVSSDAHAMVPSHAALRLPAASTLPPPPAALLLQHATRQELSVPPQQPAQAKARAPTQLPKEGPQLGVADSVQATANTEMAAGVPSASLTCSHTAAHTAPAPTVAVAVA
eukprot:5187123-Pleurochrysis_carterae.AAC.1